MKTLIIMPSIRLLKHWHTYEENATNHNFDLKDIEVMIIDEDDLELREQNDKILANVNHHFFGSYERHKWLRYMNILNYENLIPQKCHAENTFGLLWAYTEDRFSNIIFMDDDTAAIDHDYFGNHYDILGDHTSQIVTNYKDKWHNLFNHFYLLPNKYPRGFPYSERNEISTYECRYENVDVIMNQGMWIDQLDLNACDILPSVNGLSEPENRIHDASNIVIGKNIYMPICSMNLGFKPEIIPAFAQVDENRFDDIWSGVIIKKIADHLGKHISNGRPFCRHLKEPRSTFKDIIAESKRLEANEHFFKYVDNTELTGKDWASCYHEVAENLYKTSDLFSTTKDYAPIKNYSSKMIDWLDCLEEL